MDIFNLFGIVDILIVGGVIAMLGGYDHRIDANRLALVVLNGHLGLAIRL